MKTLVQPIKWHGGKHYLKSWIIDLMPPHLHYVEPYFGGGSVLLARDPDRDWMGSGLPASQRGSSEVVNDIHGELINFWQVLQSEEYFQTFCRVIQATPFSEHSFNTARENVLSGAPVDDAVNFFVLARQSRQGLMKDFATLSRNRTRSRMNEQASAWLNCIEGLADVHERLRSVVILNRDALKVIESQDGENTLFYCDPPYLHETRSTTGEYNHEMTEQDHMVMLDVLSCIEGKFMLSGYANDIYSKWEKKWNWNRHEKKIDNKAASGETKKVMTECLWCNF